MKKGEGIMPKPGSLNYDRELRIERMFEQDRGEPGGEILIPLADGEDAEEVLKEVLAKHVAKLDKAPPPLLTYHEMAGEAMKRAIEAVQALFPDWVIAPPMVKLFLVSHEGEFYIVADRPGSSPTAISVNRGDVLGE